MYKLYITPSSVIYLERFLVEKHIDKYPDHGIVTYNKKWINPKLNNLFSELGSLYFRLSKENKSKVKRPIHPQEPYVRLMKNDVVFYKLRKDLTKEDKLLFPPPPVPMNASEEEKQKAKMEFEIWKKRTGNTLNEIPPAPKKPKKEVIKTKNVKSALKVKDTIPEKKVKPKITFNNSKTLKEESFVNALKNLICIKPS